MCDLIWTLLVLGTDSCLSVLIPHCSYLKSYLIELLLQSFSNDWIDSTHSFIQRQDRTWGEIISVFPSSASHFRCSVQGLLGKTCNISFSTLEEVDLQNISYLQCTAIISIWQLQIQSHSCRERGAGEEVKWHFCAVKKGKTFDRDRMSRLCSLIQLKALYHIL